MVFVPIFSILLLSRYALANHTCKKYYFPKKFKFSVATAAFQVEGGAREDGKGPSMLDIYYHRIPGAYVGNQSADISCDSYHKYKADVQLLKYLGVQQYRFSISWSRILPDGTLAKINPKGIQYYNNLINELIENGIEPMITITHGDEPEGLIEMGGWLNQDMPRYYGKYARLLFKHFGDRVKKWLTLNEILPVASFCYCGLTGVGAPGNFSMLCPWTYYRATHHMLLGHAEAYRIYEKEFKTHQKGQIGMALSTSWYEPATNSTEDIAAAKRAFDFSIGWITDPLFTGDYPFTMRKRIAERSIKDGYLKSRLPAFTDKEKQKINGTLDFIGINFYAGSVIQNREDFPYGIGQAEYDGGFEGGSGPGAGNQALRKLINYLYRKYRVPIVITENGLGDNTGALNDTYRIEYLKNSLIPIQQAIEDGSNVWGYTVWSLMDNFEWGSGFTVKYGLYYIDFDDPNRKRIPKASSAWYKQTISQRYIEDC